MTLEEIESVLSRTSGNGYIDRINGKIDELMQKLIEGDMALSEEGHNTGYPGDTPYLSTDHLAGTLTDLVGVDPASFDPAIVAYSRAALLIGADQLHDKAIELVNPETTAAGTVSEYVGNAEKTIAGDGTPGDPGWSGDSAVSFEENFAKYYVGPGQAAVNQRWMLNSLQAMMEAHQAVYARTRDDVEKLLDKALEAAGTAGDLTPGGSVTTLLTVAAAVVAVPVAAATATAALPVVAAALSSSATILGALAPDEADEKKLAGDSTYYLFFDIQNAADDIKTKRDNREEHVQTTLQGFLGGLSGDTRRKIVGPAVLDANGNNPVDGGDLDDDYRDDYVPPA
ncbi:MAG TPA: hypothetical protein H9881_18275 [Candidatus Stackebrandtia excrementipullorum]|nr:hypothetical protein [Candidatus Stackebrandtia excrementipullorum]